MSVPRLEPGSRERDLDPAARLTNLALHPKRAGGLLARVLPGTPPLLERRVHLVHVVDRLVVRGGVYQGEFQEFGDRRGLLARLAVLRGAGQRVIRAAGLGPEEDRVPIGRVRVARSEPEEHGLVTVKTLLLAPQGHEEPPLSAEGAARGVQRDPTSPEHQAAPHDHEDEPHQDDQRPGPDGNVGGVAHRHDSEADQDHEDSGQEEREAEHREAAPTLFDLKPIRRHQPEWACRSHASSPPCTPRRGIP